VLTGGDPRRDGAAREKLAEAALASSIAERRAMEVERAIVDLYRTFMMKAHVGKRFEGTVTAVVGSGIFVQLDAPFVDVLVRLEDLGQDRYEIDDDGLRVVAARSGDVVALGDRLVVEITDAAILRRTVYARRIGGEPQQRGKRPRHEETPRRDDRGRHPKTAAKGRPSRAPAAHGRDDRRKLERAGRREKKVTGGGKRKGKKGRGR
jgi:ribonuclease R